MNYLQRFQNGEYELDWQELGTLGHAVRQEPHFEDACAVATETMRRVRRNCERLVARLNALGYVFGKYPDGSSGYYSEGPLVGSSNRMRDDVAALEELVGPLPLSLVAFWQEVGSVDWVGMGRGWTDMLDPLVVYPPEAALAEFEMEGGQEQIEDAEQYLAVLAPDAFHKDNVSGGAPYSVALPDANADFILQDEWHNLHFVPYLRLAVLRYGGFPGLDGRDVPFEPLGSLIQGLEPF